MAVGTHRTHNLRSQYLHCEIEPQVLGGSKVSVVLQERDTFIIKYELDH